MSIKSEDDFTFGKFTGLRNTVPSQEFGVNDLEVAVNVDINDSGVVARRKGYGTPVVAGSYHSVWASGPLCLAVTGTTLVRITAAYGTETLRTGLTAGQRMYYVPVGARVYYSNRVETGVIESGQSRSWGMAVPPRLAATATPGNLRAGRYQFAMTYLRSDGQESGSSLAGVLDVDGDRGISFSGLPVPTDPGVSAKAVYVSEPNGETMFRQAVLAADATAHAIRDDPVKTLALRTQHLSPPPPGAHLALYRGRLVVATDRGIAYSEPYAYELFDRRAVIPFENRVTMVAPVWDGVYVGTDVDTSYLDGTDMARSVLVDKAGYGVIPGTLAYASASAFGKGEDDGTIALWASTQGLCVGSDGGKFRNLTQDRFAYPAQPWGAALFRQHRGMNQYIAVLQGAETQGNIFV